MQLTCWQWLIWWLWLGSFYWYRYQILFDEHRTFISYHLILFLKETYINLNKCDWSSSRCSDGHAKYCACKCGLILLLNYNHGNVDSHCSLVRSDIDFRPERRHLLIQLWLWLQNRLAILYYCLQLYLLVVVHRLFLQIHPIIYVHQMVIVPRRQDWQRWSTIITYQCCQQSILVNRHHCHRFIHDHFSIMRQTCTRMGNLTRQTVQDWRTTLVYQVAVLFCQLFGMALWKTCRTVFKVRICARKFHRGRLLEFSMDVNVCEPK